ncbi:unnamed protein product [Arctogadus glacialis]
MPPSPPVPTPRLPVLRYRHHRLTVLRYLDHGANAPVPSPRLLSSSTDTTASSPSVPTPPLQVLRHNHAH